MERNADLLRAVATRIRERPDNYDQHTYFHLELAEVADQLDTDNTYQWQRIPNPIDCGTHSCVAGTACVLAGWGVEVMMSVEGYDDPVFAFVRPDGESVRMIEVREAAGELLGLAPFEAKVLFSGQWEPAEPLTVPEALEKLAAGAPMIQVTAPWHYKEMRLAWPDEPLDQ